MKKLKNYIRKLILGVDISNYYFAQGGEDAILQSIFRKKMDRGEKGFFVDVGAYHPYRDSNTYLFYRKGWRGINIDATPGSMKPFNKLRPRDINLEAGISNSENVLDYYWISGNSTMNSFSKDNLLKNGMFNSVKKVIPVQSVPLKNILSRHSSQFNKIDLLNIDVEGMDLEVLQSNDWKQFNPDVIAIELECGDIDDLNSNASAVFLKSQGYKPIAKNLILTRLATVFFVREDFDF